MILYVLKWPPSSNTVLNNRPANKETRRTDDSLSDGDCGASVPSIESHGVASPSVPTTQPGIPVLLVGHGGSGWQRVATKRRGSFVVPVFRFTVNRKPWLRLQAGAMLPLTLAVQAPPSWSWHGSCFVAVCRFLRRAWAPACLPLSPVHAWFCRATFRAARDERWWSACNLDEWEALVVCGPWKVGRYLRRRLFVLGSGSGNAQIG